MREKMKELELEIHAPAMAKPGEEIKIKASIKGGQERRTIRRLELIVNIEWHTEYYGYGSRIYSLVDMLRDLGFFGGYRRPITEYYFRSEMSRRPVRRIILARDIEFMPLAKEEYDLRVKLLEPGFLHPGFLWKLTLAARIPFGQDPVAVTYIKPITELG